MLMGNEFAKLSGSFRFVSVLINLQFDAKVDWLESRMPQAAPAIQTLEQVTEHVRRAASGEVFFVHVLLPHYPYVMNSGCGLKSPANWLNRRTIDPMTSRQSAYYEQLSCVLKVLKPIFDAAGTTAAVIVHGDHGSRLTTVDPRADTLGRFGAADMIAGFSTLFAVRAPQVAAGYDRRPLPIGVLLREFVEIWLSERGR